MNITRDQLTEADFDILYTRNPGNFIEAIIVNLMWAKDNKDEAAVIARQRFVFERWLEFYSKFVWDEATAATAVSPDKLKSLVDNAFRRGQLHALHNLPFKKGVLGRSVDLGAVAGTIRQLKAEEPVGVTSNAPKQPE